jgi:DNA-binding PadR family transcriptional regulator
VPYLKRVTLSFETLIWVRTQKTGSPISRAVLRVLADHAGQDHSCYLRTKLITAETELSESSVRKALVRLVESGFVRVYERYDRTGKRVSNRYQLLPEGRDTPPPDAEDWADVRQQKEGDTPSHTEGPLSTTEVQTLSTTEGIPYSEASSSEATPVKGAAAQRATRIPDNYQPTEEMRAWFVAEQLGAVIDGRIEHDKFVDYWLGCPGVKGRKVDWPATWRNWMRTAAERAPRRPGNGLVPTSGAPYRPSTTDARISQGMALAAKYEEQGL